MSETKRRTGNTAIAYGDMKAKENGKEIVIEQGNYGPSKNEVNGLAGMEIKVEGYEIVLDEKTGKLLRIKDNRTLSEILDDKKRARIMEALGKQEKEGFEH